MIIYLQYTGTKFIKYYVKKKDIDRIETCTSERKPSKALEIYMYLVLVKYTYGTCKI